MGRRAVDYTDIAVEDRRAAEAERARFAQRVDLPGFDKRDKVFRKQRDAGGLGRSVHRADVLADVAAPNQPAFAYGGLLFGRERAFFLR